MTMRKCCSDKSICFGLGMMRRNWSQTLLYFLAFFFTMTVPIMFGITALEDSTFKIERMLSSIDGIGFASVIVCSAVTVFSGCASMRYLSNKVKTIFYHSLPIKRERLYICCYLGGVASWVIAYLGATLVSTFALCVSGYGVSGIPAVLWTYFGYGILYGFVFFSITVFAGSLTGSTPIQFLLTCVILGILPVMYLSIYGLTGVMLGDRIWVDYYFSIDTLMYLSPFVRLICIVNEDLSGLETVLTAVCATVFAVLGLFFHRIRKTEHSARPVAFDWVGSAVKYVCAFPITILGGLMFYSLGRERLVWLFFGFACGLLLWTMLVNTIVNKSAKAMFKGVKGLCVFAVLFAIFTAVYSFDCFGWVTYAPAPADCDSAEVMLYGNLYTLEKDELANVGELLAPNDEVGYSSVNCALHKGNRTYAVRKWCNNETFEAIKTAVRQSEEFIENTFVKLDSYDYFEGNIAVIHEGKTFDRHLSFSDMPFDAEKFCEAFYKDIEGDTDIFSTFIVGCVRIEAYIDGGLICCDYPVYITFENTINYLQSVIDSTYDDCEILTEDNFDVLVSAVNKIKVTDYTVNNTTVPTIAYEDMEAWEDKGAYEYQDPTVEITDREQIKQIISSMVSPGYFHLGIIRNFFATNDGYSVAFYFNSTYGEDYASESFYLGKEPDFVVTQLNRMVQE